MLERVLVVRHVVVVVVGVGEECAAGGEHVRRTDVWCRQLRLLWVLDDEHFLRLAVEVLAQLVAQVGVRVAVADYLHRLRRTDTAVVGGDDDAAVDLRECAEQVCHHRMAEPRERYRAVSRLVVGEFAHHFRFGSCVREHIDEVHHDDVEVVLRQLVEARQQLVGTRRVVHLVIRERVVAAVAFYLRANERFLVEVLALVFVLVHPQLGEHLLNLLGHQAREDGVACVLRSRRQDAGVHVLLYVEHVANLLRQHAPLVVAEVVDDDEEHLLALVYRREYLALEDVWAHQRAFGYARCHPRQVVLLYELGEAVVCFLFLHLQHLGHVAVRRAKLQFPVYQSAVRILPVVYRVAVHYLH